MVESPFAHMNSAGIFLIWLMNILKLWWGILNKNLKLASLQCSTDLSDSIIQWPNLPMHYMLMTVVSICRSLHKEATSWTAYNQIIVLESDFSQTLAPLCDPNATFEHLRQMMSPLWTWICRHVSGYIIDKAVCISQDSTLNSMLTYLFSGKKWGVCAIK